MHGWTTKPRKAGSGCLGCHQERGAVIQALIGRLNRVGSIWLCAGCAASAEQRQAFIDEYARRAGAAAAPAGRQRGERS